jgi:hypothetical protein
VLINEKNINFFIVMFATNIEFAFADWPHRVTCPKITSVSEPAEISTVRNGFTSYSPRSNDPYPAEKFIGADIKNYNTFSCNYEVNDGTQVIAKFTRSKCQAMVGFDISGKCNDPDPEQCTAICAY